MIRSPAVDAKIEIGSGSTSKPAPKQREGKIAVITGGNSGLGLAAAERFVTEGAYVFIIGRRQAELDAAVKLIGKTVTAGHGDVGKLEDLDRCTNDT